MTHSTYLGKMKSSVKKISSEVPHGSVSASIPIFHFYNHTTHEKTNMVWYSYVKEI